MAKASSLRFNARTRTITIPLKPWSASTTVRNYGGPIPAHAELPSSVAERYRIVRASLGSLVVPASSSAMTVNVLVYDKSEGAEDTIVSGFDAKSITAKQANDMPLAAETAERERTIQPGDGIIVDLVAAGTITTNWAQGDAVVAIELLPLDVPGEGFGRAL
jgi:hypothetical protein